MQPDDWLMVNVCPPAVMVPVLAGPVLAATEYPTVPLPVPDEPDVMVIQVLFDAAVHEQAELPGVTDTVPASPEATAVADVAPSE